MTMDCGRDAARHLQLLMLIPNTAIQLAGYASSSFCFCLAPNLRQTLHYYSNFGCGTVWFRRRIRPWWFLSNAHANTNPHMYVSAVHHSLIGSIERHSRTFLRKADEYMTLTNECLLILSMRERYKCYGRSITLTQKYTPTFRAKTYMTQISHLLDAFLVAYFVSAS